MTQVWHFHSLSAIRLRFRGHWVVLLVVVMTSFPDGRRHFCNLNPPSWASSAPSISQSIAAFRQIWLEAWHYRPVALQALIRQDKSHCVTFNLLCRELHWTLQSWWKGVMANGEWKILCGCVSHDRDQVFTEYYEHHVLKSVYKDVFYYIQ